MFDNKYAAKFWSHVAKIPGDITPGQVEMVVGEVAAKENREIVQQLLEGIPDLSSASLMELGCGEGRLMKYIAPQVKEYIGIDVTQVVLDRARQMAEEKAFSNVRFFDVGNESTLVDILGRESVDAVVSFTVFMHMPANQLKEYFHEINFILKVGGRFQFNCSYPSQDISERFDNIPEGDLFMARWFPEELIESFLKEAGLCIKTHPAPPHMIWKTQKRNNLTC